MALLKAFVCQIVLLGLYKLFLEQVVEEHLVPDELTRNCLVGFVCLLCFGIQLYTEKVEEQASRAEASKAKSRRRSPPDTAESISEFLDARTVHMMKTLDAAMQNIGQMPVSDAFVQNVVFAAAGPEAAVIEQTFTKQPDVVVIEEIHMTKLDEYTNEKNDKKSNISAFEPSVVPLDKNESEEEEEEVEEEETEAKSDVCEEEEEDVVTVIDASKPKPEATESEEEEQEEEEEEEEEEETEKETLTTDNKKNVKVEEKPVVKQSKVQDEEEEEEEEEESEEEETIVKKEAGKVTKTS